MDSVVAQLLARLSMFLAQELDFQVDTQRFDAEPEYASQVLELAEEMGHHEFAAVAGQIRKRLLERFSLKATSEPVEGDTTALLPPEEGTQTQPGKNG